MTIVGLPELGGEGFRRAAVDTAGVSGDARLQVRMPIDLWMSLGLRQSCSLQVEGTPFWAFRENAQISAWEASEVSNVICDEP